MVYAISISFTSWISIWSAISKQIETARKYPVNTFFKKVGLRNDQPSSDARTTSTRNVLFFNKNNIIFHASTFVLVEIRFEFVLIQNNLSAFLRIYNSSHEIDAN